MKVSDFILLIRPLTSFDPDADIHISVDESFLNFNVKTAKGTYSLSIDCLD